MIDKLYLIHVFGPRLRAWMQARGTKIQMLAAHSDVSVGTLNNWMQGTHNPCESKMRSVARTLAVPIALLYPPFATTTELLAVRMWLEWHGLKPFLDQNHAIASRPGFIDHHRQFFLASPSPVDRLLTTLSFHHAIASCSPFRNNSAVIECFFLLLGRIAALSSSVGMDTPPSQKRAEKIDHAYFDAALSNHLPSLQDCHRLNFTWLGELLGGGAGWYDEVMKEDTLDCLVKAGFI